MKKFKKKIQFNFLHLIKFFFFLPNIINKLNIAVQLQLLIFQFNCIEYNLISIFIWYYRIILIFYCTLTCFFLDWMIHFLCEQNETKLETIEISICIYVTANLRIQIFPGIPNPFRESGKSLKWISSKSNLTWNNWRSISEIPGINSPESLK